MRDAEGARNGHADGTGFGFGCRLGACFLSRVGRVGEGEDAVKYFLECRFGIASASALALALASDTSML